MPALFRAASVGLLMTTLGLTVGVATVLVPGDSMAALRVSADDVNQPWLVAHIEDRWVQGQNVTIQFPLEWLREARPIVLRGEGGAPDLHLNGPGLLEVGHTLAIGQALQVGAQESKWDHTRVEVSARAPVEAARAKTLRFRVVAEGHFNDIDIALPLGVVTKLENILRAAWLHCDRCQGRADGVEQLTARIPELRELPPFDLVRVEGGPTQILIRTESE